MSIITNIILGATLAAIPGPIFVEVVRRTLTKGFLSGALVGLGEFFATFVILSAAYLGVERMGTFSVLLFFIGGVILIFLGYKAFKKKEIISSEQSQKSSILTGFILALSSPLAWTTWISIGAASITNEKVIESMVALAVGVILFFTILAGILTLSKKNITPKVLITISRTCGILLIGYGVYFVGKGIHSIYS